MPDEVQNPPTPTADAIPEEVGSMDAAERAFAARDNAPEVAEKADEQPADATDEAEAADPSDDPDEGQPDEDTEQAEELKEIELDGKKYLVAPAVEKASLRQADYSRKMNDVAEKARAATAHAEQAQRLADAAEKRADVLADIRMHDHRLDQFRALDWQQIRAQNPAEYAALAADLQAVNMARQQAVEKSNGVVAEVEKARGDAFATDRASMESALSKDLKGWGEKMGIAVTQYAISAGVKAETLQRLTDPGLVMALEKARKWDEANKKAADLRATAKPVPPVLKPGAPRQADPKSDAMARLRRSNSQADAEAAFLARMR